MSKPNNSFFLPLLTILLQLSSLLFLQTHFTLCNGISPLGLTSMEKGSSIDGIVRIGLEDPEMEPEMSSSRRRILVGQRSFISYETLNRDRVPCGKPGASYYDCHGEVAANPYTRGCEIITRCARDIKDTNT